MVPEMVDAYCKDRAPDRRTAATPHGFPREREQGPTLKTLAPPGRAVDADSDNEGNYFIYNNLPNRTNFYSLDRPVPTFL
jgi:hypothetical protein